MENNYKELYTSAIAIYDEARKSLQAVLAYAETECKKANDKANIAEKAYFAAEESGASDEECNRLADEYEQLQEVAYKWADEVDFLESKLS